MNNEPKKDEDSTACASGSAVSQQETEGSMPKRYLALCLVEELVLAGLLLYGNSLAAEEVGPYHALPLTALVLAAFALTDAAVYLQNRGTPWRTLFAWEKVLRVISAFVSGVAVFMTAFALAGTAFDYTLAWFHLYEFSVGYGCCAGTIALVLADFAGEPGFGFRRSSGDQDETDDIENQE